MRKYDIETRNLGCMIDTGRVYRKVEDGDDELIGFVDDEWWFIVEDQRWPPLGLFHQWLWIAKEVKDRRRLADGIQQAAQGAFERGHSPELWT